MSELDQILQQAIVQHQNGHLQAAEAGYKEVLAIDPGQADANHLLGVIAYQVGKYDIAERLISKAIETDSGQPLFFLNLGNTLQEQGRFDEAVTSYDKALALNPDFPEAHNNKGNALKSLEEVDLALGCFKKALALRIDYAEAHNNLGNLLKDIGRIEEAIAHLEQAVRLEPAYADAHFNLARALHENGQTERAVNQGAQALALKPDFVDAHINQGIYLQKLGRLDESLSRVRHAVTLAPWSAPAHTALANTLRDFGQFEEALTSYRQAIDLDPGFEEAHSNLLMTLHYAPESTHRDLFTAAQKWAAPYNDNLPVRPQIKIPDPNRRLRVGYVSGDFSRHPVGFYLERILPFHKPDSVEVYGYSTKSKVDDTTERLKDAMAQWRNVHGLSDEAFVRQIREDEIDILVDLSGHTAGHRLSVFAARPAPIQVTWMGYTGTTGLNAMDYILADTFVLPENERELFSETVKYLPGCYLCFDPPRFDIAAAPPPVQVNGHVTFGSFSNRIKITPQTVAAWAKILKAVEGSKLLLKTTLLDDPEVRKALQEEFTNQGVATDRLVLEGGGPRADLLAAYRRIDIALDSLPFSGGVTTAEALWMGVPVINLKSARWSGRLGETILNAVGAPELVAPDLERYHDLAVELAADRPRLEGYHASLREQMLSSPLCDGPAFAAKLEQAFRELWLETLQETVS